MSTDESESGGQGGEADGRYLRLLEIDDELAETVPLAERDVAKGQLTARLVTFSTGDGEELVSYAPPGCLGLIVIEGFVTRNVVFAGRKSRELIGPGDLLRPWDLERDFLPPFAEAGFTVIEDLRLAHLDRSILALGGRWPGFVDELIHRAIDRSRWLAVRLAISSANRVDERLLLFLWHSAGRWGRMTQEGVLLPFSFTHSMLAELVGARRATITTAMSHLRKTGEVALTAGAGGSRRIVLPGEPPERLAATTRARRKGPRRG